MNLINGLVASQGGYSPQWYRIGPFKFHPNPNFPTVYH